MMLSSRFVRAPVAALVLAVGGMGGCSSCQPDNPGNADASTGGQSDAGRSDAGLSDAGRTDSGACTAGTRECSCLPNSTCSSGLVCASGVCTDGVAGTLTVSDPAVRSCEVLFRDGAAAVVGVTPGAGIRARVLSESPRTALVFSAERDTSIAAGSVQLVVRGNVADLDVRQTRCFDRTGQLLSAAQVSIQ